MPCQTEGVVIAEIRRADFVRGGKDCRTAAASAGVSGDSIAGFASRKDRIEIVQCPESHRIACL